MTLTKEKLDELWALLAKAALRQWKALFEAEGNLRSASVASLVADLRAALAQTPATDDDELIKVLSETSWDRREPITDTLTRWSNVHHEAAIRLTTLRSERDDTELVGKAYARLISGRLVGAGDGQTFVSEVPTKERFTQVVNEITAIRIATLRAEIERLRAELAKSTLNPA